MTRLDDIKNRTEKDSLWGDNDDDLTFLLDLVERAVPWMEKEASDTHNQIEERLIIKQWLEDMRGEE